MAGVALLATFLLMPVPAAAQNLGACRAGGDLDAAIAACTALINLDGATISSERRGYAHYVRGLLRRQRLEYPEAIDDFTRAFELNRKDIASLFNRGEVRALIGLLEQGEADAREALRLAPRSAPAHAALGRVLQQMNRHSEALDIFTAALSLDSRDRGALLGRARSLSRLGRHGEATQAFAAAVAAYPNDAEILREQQLALALSRPAEVAVAQPQAQRPPSPQSALGPTAPAGPTARAPALPPVSPAVRAEPPPSRDSEPAPSPLAVATRNPRPADPQRLEVPTPNAIEPAQRAPDPSRTGAPLAVRPPLEPRSEPVRPLADRQQPVPSPVLAPPARIAEAPRGERPDTVAAAPPSDAPSPVGSVRTTFFCGMVESWREHAARYAGVQLDALGCARR